MSKPDKPVVSAYYDEYDAFGVVMLLKDREYLLLNSAGAAAIYKARDKAHNFEDGFNARISQRAFDDGSGGALDAAPVVIETRVVPLHVTIEEITE